MERHMLLASRCAKASRSMSILPKDHGCPLSDGAQANGAAWLPKLAQDAVRSRMVDEIVWVKMTVNRRLAKSHGYYLQHAKEVCLVGRKGLDPPGMSHGVGSDIIYAERRGQSQKPEEIYQLIEELVPNGVSPYILRRDAGIWLLVLS